MCGFENVVYDVSIRQYKCTICRKELGKSFRELVKLTLPNSYVEQLDKQCLEYNNYRPRTK